MLYGELEHIRFEGVRGPRPLLARRRANHHSRGHAGDHGEGPVHPLVQWVLQQAGLDAEIYRSRPLLRRLPACLRALHCSTADEARENILGNPDSLSTAVDALLLGVTEFYRDASVFDSLAHLLPRLPRRGLRVWCAACSNGAEVYSVAMLLAELGMLAESTLLGTDCRVDAINEARAGVYAPHAAMTLPRALRDRYMIPSENGFTVAPEIRAHTRFETQDLMHAKACGPCDLVLWRNSAIYLRAVAASAVWQTIADSLARDGLLVTGRAERPECASEFRRIASCIYVKTMEGQC